MLALLTTHFENAYAECMSTTRGGQAPSPINMNVSTRVRILLVLEGMKQKDLAERLGVHQSVISDALNGQRRWSLDDLDHLARVFDRPITFFLEPAEELLRSRCSALVAEQLSLPMLDTLDDLRFDFAHAA